MIEPEKRQLPGLLKGEEAQIDYTVTPFPAMQAMRLAVKLAKTFGNGLGEVASGGMANALDVDAKVMVQSVLTSLDEEQTPKLVAEILAKTQRNGVFLNEEVIDKVYTQNFGELFKALQFALEVNFGGFIGALAQASQSIGSEPADSAGEKS